MVLVSADDEEKLHAKAPPGADTECERYYSINYNSIFYPFPGADGAVVASAPSHLSTQQSENETAKDAHFHNEWISIRPFFCQN